MGMGDVHDMMSCLALIFLMPVLLGAIVLRGYVFSILWGWFIVPTFHVQTIGIPLAIGIMITIGELTRQYVPAKDNDTWMPMCTAILTPLLALLCGWILRFWL